MMSVQQAIIRRVQLGLTSLGVQHPTQHCIVKAPTCFCISLAQQGGKHVLHHGGKQVLQEGWKHFAQQHCGSDQFAKQLPGGKHVCSSDQFAKHFRSWESIFCNSTAARSRNVQSILQSSLAADIFGSSKMGLSLVKQTHAFQQTTDACQASRQCRPKGYNQLECP